MEDEDSYSLPDMEAPEEATEEQTQADPAHEGATGDGDSEAAGEGPGHGDAGLEAPPASRDQTMPSTATQAVQHAATAHQPSSTGLVSPSVPAAASSGRQQHFVLAPPLHDSSPGSAPSNEISTGAQQQGPPAPVQGMGPAPQPSQPSQQHAGIAALPVSRSTSSVKQESAGSRPATNTAVVLQQPHHAAHALQSDTAQLGLQQQQEESASMGVALQQLQQPHIPQQEQEQQQQHTTSYTATHPVRQGMPATRAQAAIQQDSTGPRYAAATSVMPKAPLEEYTNEATQAVMLAFSTGSWFGIRSLPNALSADFKLQLYQQFMQQHEQERNALRGIGGALLPPGFGPSAAAGNQPQQAAMGPGMRPVARTHPHAGTFTTYDYLPSEYDRGKLGNRFQRLQNKLAQVTPLDFVVRATPAAPKGAPSFCEFEYVAEPNVALARMQLDDDNAARAAALAGPFVLAGRPKSQMALRGRADECMQALCKLLSNDWRSSFMQVFEDKTGALVLCFDQAAAVAQGDLSAYMQQLAKNHWLTSEFRLTKDGSQWGLQDLDTGVVFYLFWPPWVRHRLVGLPQGKQQQGTAQLDAQETAAAPGPTSEASSSPSAEGAQGGALGLPRHSLGLGAMLLAPAEPLGALSRSAAAAQQPSSAADSGRALGSAAGRGKPNSRGLDSAGHMLFAAL